ncbi:MAG TPA: hypothetical protein VGO53_06185 [Steroidobacteraceae bacterium]|nr:hypothetical protein [Steroidobacteraceae bacterium]
MSETKRVTAIVDAHVHIHSCYEPDVFLDHAYNNLSRSPGGRGGRGGDGPAANGQSPVADPAYFLLMTESAGDDYFGALRSAANPDTRSFSAGQKPLLKRWSVTATAEPECVVARDGDRRLYIVGGRQVACREGLEVLILGTIRRFRDGLPIRDVLMEAGMLGVPHVIPWGMGKWFFQRGKLLSALLRDFRKPTLFLGDEGGRPGFWPYPAHFREGAALGVRDLPGTDPLPFAHDVEKVGRMGFRVGIDLDESRPVASLFRTLCDSSTQLDRFATLEPPLLFVRNQVAMQLRKRRSA